MRDDRSRTGVISEIWVRWRQRPHLFFSGPHDRDYVIERSQGRVSSATTAAGACRLLPPTTSGWRPTALAAAWPGTCRPTPCRSCSAVCSRSQVTEPARCRGRCGRRDGERGQPPPDLQVIRHRGRSLSAGDYEALALEASPAVAVARALPATHRTAGPPRGGSPSSIVPTPPTAAAAIMRLRRRVREFLTSRAPAGIGGRIAVIGPTYLPIGIQAALSPLGRSEAGLVVERALRSLAQFLHPLTGGRPRWVAVRP